MNSPTRYRYFILGLLCLLAMITYMDRAANGSARDAIMKDLNANGSSYTKDDFHWVLMAFQLAYAIFEVPSGFLGDRFGPRSTLLRVVLWWTLFVALTGFTGMTIGGLYIGFGLLLVMQFLFGVGEAGAFPNISKSLYNWFPATQRGTAKSIIWMSARLMGGLTPLVWVLLTDLGGLSWREAMWLFAGIAGFWCVAFYLTFRNTPEEVRGVNPEERAIINEGRSEVKAIRTIPWGQFVRSRNLWMLCGMYVVTNFCWYFLMYNLPGKLKDQFPEWNDTSNGRMLLALLAGSPLLIGMFGCLAGGTISDWLIKKTGSRRYARQTPGVIGYGTAGLCYAAAAAANYYDPSNLWLFAGLLILMGFFNDLIMAPAWAVAQDIGQEYSATVSGAMNMFGNLVGSVSGIFFTGQIMKNYPVDGIIICFCTYTVVYFIGAGLWLAIDPTKPVASEQQSR
jgi:MFS transporter, ACS family, glucarate transporter